MQRYLVLALAQVAVGAAAIFARFALTGAGALAVSAARLGIAALVLWVVWGLVRLGRPEPVLSEVEAMPQDDTAMPQHDTAMQFDWRLAAAGAALAVHFATWIASLEYTSVATSTLLVATTPVWTALYDALIAKRPVSPLAWFAMVAGGAGVAAIVSFANVAPPVAGHELLGAGLALTGAVAIGAYLLIVRSVRAIYETRTIVTQTFTWAALALLAATLIAREPFPAFNNGAAWGGIIAMALVSQLLGHTALNASLRWFSASAVAFTSLLEPLSAAILAFFIFGEQLGALALAGGVLILLAIAAFLREEQRLTPQV